jgi:hypothetical protein
MRRSLEQRRNLVAEAIRRLPKQRPMPTYQKVVFWIIILGAFFLVLDVVFFR